jgi:hypothetical protein
MNPVWIQDLNLLDIKSLNPNRSCQNTLGYPQVTSEKDYYFFLLAKGRGFGGLINLLIKKHGNLKRGKQIWKRRLVRIKNPPSTVLI